MPLGGIAIHAPNLAAKNSTITHGAAGELSFGSQSDEIGDLRGARDNGRVAGFHSANSGAHTLCHQLISLRRDHLKIRGR